MSKPRVSSFPAGSVRKADLSSLSLEELRGVLRTTENAAKQARDGHMDRVWARLGVDDVARARADFLDGTEKTAASVRDEIRRRTTN